jgi:hypothetical protein
MPAGVPAAAVSQTDNVPDEDLVRAEVVSVGAATRRFGHPCAVDGSDELPLVHARDCNPHHDRGLTAYWLSANCDGCRHLVRTAILLPVSCDDAWHRLNTATGRGKTEGTRP